MTSNNNPNRRRLNENCLYDECDITGSSLFFEKMPKDKDSLYGSDYYNTGD
jgi:hypothetical protein